ncbi:serine acetyltransferase [Vibrio sp. THAF190c]|uniref:serine acetyltransferase n=1 Tax=Vibrio sp. THAF190c TaxID=2587865 RepID=UPI00126953D6|nr:serine acetyltransferase [Vibrio sp. THAF190c]QFT08593.1 Serine acetyltransferase [Vibrio sp. THAF190c]
MIARVVVALFGSIWKVKKRCNSNNKLVSKFYKLLYGFYQYENNSSIAWNSEFSSEPCFPHGIKSIFVSGQASIGHNCVIFQQVTIGSVTLADAKSKGAPVIGDNVYVGSGAKIIGSVRVGNNVRIGANAVVYKDVPDNSVVTNGEQRIISRNTVLNNRFYSYHGKWVYFDRGSYIEELDKSIIDSLNRSQDIGG